MVGDTSSPEAPATVKSAVANSFDMTLDEFCVRKSSENVGPEMLAGFYQAQRTQGVIKNSGPGFQKALDAFASQPA